MEAVKEFKVQRLGGALASTGYYLGYLVVEEKEETAIVEYYNGKLVEGSVRVVWVESTVRDRIKLLGSQPVAEYGRFLPEYVLLTEECPFNICV